MEKIESRKVKKYIFEWKLLFFRDGFAVELTNYICNLSPKLLCHKRKHVPA